MAHYLLPCNCGRKHSITTAQAGDRLQCECGRSVDVPTLRHLAALERVEEAAAPRRASNWGAPQGLVFLGTAIVLLAAAGLVWLQITEPQKAEGKIIMSADVDKMTPGEVWIKWPFLQTGIIRQLVPFEVYVLSHIQHDFEIWRQLRLAAFIVGGIGFTVIAAGLLLPTAMGRPTLAKGMKADG